MKIVSADFISSAQDERGYPKGGYKEVAFSGRSNVGKSSMINTLLGRRKLVRTSKTPGHTRKLNFFLINGRFVLVDLPGYGYAAVPESVKRAWGPMVDTYLRDRKELGCVVVIIDVRHPLTSSDLRLIDFLRAHEKPFVVAATKADKLTYSGLKQQQQAFRDTLGPQPPLILFSSHDGTGKNELWKEIKNLIE